MSFLIGIGAFHLAAVGGRGKELDDRVQQRVDADVAHRGGGEHGEDAAGEHRLAQPAHEVFLGQGALVEELLDQVLVALRDHLDELLAPARGRLLDLGGHLDGLELAALVVVVHVGLARHEVGHAHEALLLAEGDGQGDDGAAERLLQRLHRAFEGRAVAVHPVHHDEARDVVVAGVAPDLLRLDLDPRHAVDHHDGGVGDAQGGAGLGEEVRVAGRVEEVQLGFAPLAVGDGGLQADLPLDLVGIEVGDGRAVVHAAEAVDRSHVEEHRGDQRRLPAASVADHGHVADGGWLVDLHAEQPPPRSVSRGCRWSFVHRNSSAFPLSAAAVLLGDGARGGDGPARQGSGREGRGAPRAGRNGDHNRQAPIMATCGLCGRASWWPSTRPGWPGPPSPAGPGAPRIRSFARAPLADGALVPGPFDPNVVRAAEVQQALARGGGGPARAAAARWPSSFPAAWRGRCCWKCPPESTAREFARYRITPGLPYAPEEALVDVLPVDGGRVLAAAVRRSVVEGYEAAAAAAGLDVERLDLAPLAALSALAREPRGTAVSVDVILGDHALSLAAWHGGVLRAFRSRLRGTAAERAALAGDARWIGRRCWPATAAAPRIRAVGPGAAALLRAWDDEGRAGEPGWRAEGTLPVEATELAWLGAALA